MARRFDSWASQYPASWYENPGKSFNGPGPERPEHWTRHFVTNAVKKEAPTLSTLRRWGARAVDGI